jgi:hypothetical protein
LPVSSSVRRQTHVPSASYQIAASEVICHGQPRIIQYYSSTDRAINIYVLVYTPYTLIGALQTTPIKLSTSPLYNMMPSWISSIRVITYFIFLAMSREITLILAPVLSNTRLVPFGVVISTSRYNVKKLLSYIATFSPLILIYIEFILRGVYFISVFIGLDSFISYSFAENSNLRASPKLVRRLPIVTSTFEFIITLTSY